MTIPVGLADPEQYAAALPFAHTIIDDVFDRERLRRAGAEIDAMRMDPLPTFYGQRLKASVFNASSMGPNIRELIAEMSSPAFIKDLETLTGITGLRADPQLSGGGVHRSSCGAFLKVHADFNWHAQLRLHRRVNLILYLNEDWRKEWGGELELWRADMKVCDVRVLPIIGRMVVFSTSDDSFHGHPTPLACPITVTRKSIALYFYSEEPASDLRFVQSQMTSYRTRAGERFHSLRYVAHRTLLRFPGLRRLLGR